MTYSPEQIAEQKELVLKLIERGYTERQQNEVEGLAGHETRAQWRRDDPVFLEQCQRARALGAESVLHEAEKKQQDAYERALDDACSPVLATMVENISRHARWRASKYAPDVFGDAIRNQNSYVDREGKPADPPKVELNFEQQVLRRLPEDVLNDILKSLSEEQKSEPDKP